MNKIEKNKWLELSTSTVSDALDKLGIKGQCFGIKPLNREFKIIGSAYTIKYIKQKDDHGTVGDYIDNVTSGSIIVIDNEGRMDASVWGDILTRSAKINCIEGTVINGVCRDTSSSLKINYPLFSKDTYMRSGKGRVQFQEANIPVTLGSIIVNSGDLVFGDADGVVVIPKKIETKILELALKIKTKELSIIESLENGVPLKEARKKFGYYSLQKRT